MELERATKLLVASTTKNVLNFFKEIRKSHEWDVTIFGVDLEWNYKYQHLHGGPSLSLLDICTATSYCVMIDMHRLRKIPDIIHNFLKAPDIIKVGLGITEQSEKLRHIYGVNVETTVDVRHLVDEEGQDPLSERKLPWIMGEPCIPNYNNFHKDPRRMTPKQITGRVSKVINFARLFTSLTMKRAREVYGYKDWELHQEERIPECAVIFWKKYFNQPFDYDKSRFMRRKLIDLIMELGDTSPR